MKRESVRAPMRPAATRLPCGRLGWWRRFVGSRGLNQPIEAASRTQARKLSRDAAKRAHAGRSCPDHTKVQRARAQCRSPTVSETRIQTGHHVVEDAIRAGGRGGERLNLGLARAVQHDRELAPASSQLGCE